MPKQAYMDVFTAPSIVADSVRGWQVKA